MAVSEIGSDSFKEAVESGLSVVDFFATWCGPCKMLGPVIEEISTEMPAVKFYKVDVDKNMQLAGDYNVMGVPTLVFFKNGNAIDKSVGVISRSELTDKLNALL